MTKIEWTRGDDGSEGKTWNPLRARRRDTGKTGWHCEKVSSGCASCYAETFNGRRLPGGGTGLAYARDKRELVETYLDEAVLVKPLRWRKPRKVFVASMTDLFGEWAPDEAIDRVFEVMARAPQHTFQVLTKRPERMRGYVAALSALPARARLDRLDIAPARRSGPLEWPLPNVWLGVSCEDQPTADARIPVLLSTPAAVRFVSAEPLLGPVIIGPRWTYCGTCRHRDEGPHDPHPARRCHFHWGPCETPEWCGCDDHAPGGVQWIIAGGESGPGARPTEVAWVRSIVEQCRAAGVPAFVKQLGANVWDRNDRFNVGDERLEDGSVPPELADHWPDATECDDWHLDPSRRYQGAPCRILLGDRKGGDPEEWPEDLRVREFPAIAQPAGAEPHLHEERA